MRRTAPIVVALLGLLIPAALSAAPADAASPWWQLLTGSRPTNLQLAPDQTEIQEVQTSTVDIDEIGEGLLIAPISVGGEPVGCLGAGNFVGLPSFFFGSPAAVCEKQTGFAAGDTVETPTELAELLESIYETEVQLAGPEGKGEAPTGFGEGAFTLITPEHWEPSLQFGPPVVVSNPFSSEPPTLTFGNSATSQVTSEGSGRLTITLTNLGNAPADASEVPLTIHDSLPKGAEAYEVRAIAGGIGEVGSVECTLADNSEFTCTFKAGEGEKEIGELPPYEAIEIEVFVALQKGAGSNTGEVIVSGSNAGGIPEGDPEGVQTLNISDTPVPFGFEYFSMRAEEEGGEETTAAGAHPFQLTTTIVANSGPESGDRSPSVSTKVVQPALPRNLRFTLPAGFVANVTKTPTCDMATFLHQTKQLANECPASAAIGAASVTVIENLFLGLTRIAVPVFNLVPGPGEPARFGVMVGGDPVVIDTSVDPENSYRASAEVRNVSQVVQFLAATTVLWGNPGAKAHDDSRGWKCVYHRAGVEELPGSCVPPTPAERKDVPFLRMPVSCASRLPFEAAIEPWNVPLGSVVNRASDEAEPLRACNQVPFNPSIENALTSRLTSNPSGLDIHIDMPNAGLENSPEGQETSAKEAISESQFKRAEVIFPKGLTINPSQAEGLAVCSEAGYARERFDSKPGEGCPEASKIGNIQISTPLLNEEADGALYVATPYENPEGSLIALYVVAKIPDRGILVKQPIEVRPDPQTGQLVGISDNVPQLPFSSFKLHFREGGRAPLITPPGCGTFPTIARFTPWSAQNPDNPASGEVIEREATFTIDHGVDGGACPSGPAPFHPGFEAGTLNNQAGSYSPFVLHLTRQDGEQDMGKFSFVLPPGIVPKLAGIPYCSDQAIARAQQSRQGPHGGHEELNAPSCPAASQIGRSVAGAGVGNQLTYVPGKLYLAGPYHGDPISAVSITPAVAGPFDAGVVVVRFALRLNPVTHVGEVDGSASDPIPHILKGIPLELRDLRAYADRPEFTLNPTSCEPFAASSTIWGDGTALEPLGEHPVELSSRFQAAGCASLGFKPKLHLKLKGGTKRGRFPALRAAYVPRKHGDANLSHLTLTFPDSEFIEQGHFRTICTRVQFAAGQGFGAECPKGSIYGHVKVSTPLLDEPLSGPVYLRSSNHNLPDAVFALHGLVDIEVAVRIDSAHGRLRANVGNVPDAPVSQAIVNMQGGQKGLFVNSRNLCFKPKRNRARVNATGQNGRRELAKPAMRALACSEGHNKRHHKRGGRR